MLVWVEPEHLYGVLSHFNIFIAKVNNSNEAWVIHRVDAAMMDDVLYSFDLDNLENLESGQYYVWVWFMVVLKSLFYSEALGTSCY